jgi:hypothetical protein
MSRNWGAIPNADWMTHKKDDPHCICMTCCPTKLGPAEYYLHHGAVLKTFERAAAGWAPKKTNSKDPSWISTALGYGTGAAKDDDRGPQAWTGWSKWKRAPQPEWKMKARSLPGLALPKEMRPVLDWMVLRHVEYKGIPLEKPVRPIRSKRAKVKRHKSPALPPELHFLSPSGVREWKKAAKRSPLPHRGEWSLPYIADIERRWRDTVEVVETADGPASRTVMPPAPVCNSLFAPDPALKKLIAEIVDDLTPTPPVRSRTRFDNPETPSATDWWAREFKTRMSLEEFMNQQPQRKKPWSKPTVSTLASLCYSSDVSLTPLPPPPVTTTADRPLTSAKLLQRNSSATA